MKRIVICILLTVMMITSCSVSEKNGADGRGAAVSTEAETGSAGTSVSEEVTEAGSGTTAVDVSGLSGYTVYPVSADYGEGNPFACEPAEGFHAFSGVKSDADTGVKTKTFEYNGKTVELTYDGKTDSSLGLPNGSSDDGMTNTPPPCCFTKTVKYARYQARFSACPKRTVPAIRRL